jgi:uncharacterized protein (TIGR02217 family)
MLGRAAYDRQTPFRQKTKRVPSLVTRLRSGLPYLAGILTFLVAAAIDVAVTADFEFDMPLRFDTDSMTATLEQVNLSQLAVPIVEITV